MLLCYSFSLSCVFILFPLFFWCINRSYDCKYMYRLVNLVYSCVNKYCIIYFVYFNFGFENVYIYILVCMYIYVCVVFSS